LITAAVTQYKISFISRKVIFGPDTALLVTTWVCKLTIANIVLACNRKKRMGSALGRLLKNFQREGHNDFFEIHDV
jgi:hypothetical protein